MKTCAETAKEFCDSTDLQSRWYWYRVFKACSDFPEEKPKKLIWEFLYKSPLDKWFIHEAILTEDQIKNISYVKEYKLLRSFEVEE